MEGAAAARGVRLEHRPAATAVGLWVDAAQLEEALRAVVANGIEALGDGGRVAVEVVAEAADGAGTLVVVDDGAGMDAATRRRAFDPFFSGREAGRGVGLGLSKARRFVEVNGGRIDLESRPGAGTRVTLRLPLATGPLGAPPDRDRRRDG
jgi:signal transduction histidine kinase